MQTEIQVAERTAQNLPVPAPAEPKQTSVVAGSEGVEKEVVESRPLKHIDVDQIDFSKVVSRVTEVVQKLGTKVAFQYDERTTQPVIRVFDDDSGELIRQIPREEMLELMAKLRDISGLIFHDSV